ncbi:ABC transporter permease [Acrocarpospora sp. B8E8]|uniref:ABC transporter permease n=1 Tax=Acrocarpospora sp. B8E8 TaxID=3153572 RepID=UPI00325ED4B1
MRFARAWLTLVAARNWRAYAGLAVLVAVVLATVLAAVAGARRGASAQERLLAGALPADMLVQSQVSDFDWDLVRALPGVAAVAPLAVSAVNVEGAQLGWDSVPPAGAEIWRSVERPVVLAGRLPDPARADEVVVLPRFTETYGKGVGDVVVIQLSTPAEVDLVGDSSGSSARHGPRIVARIVGVIRSPYFVDQSGSRGALLPSPGLFLTYRENFIGAKGRGGFTNALVRLEGGERGIPAFLDAFTALAGRPTIEIDNLADLRRQTDRLLGYEAAALLALGLAALAAGGLMCGQFTARLVGAAIPRLLTLRAAGLAPKQAVAAAALGPALAGALGGAGGVLGAAAASPWLPIGAAAVYEPRPGFDLDWAVLLPGLFAVSLAIALGAAVYGRVLLAAGRSPGRTPSVIAVFAGRRGWPVPLQSGLRFALERGRGLDPQPVGSALAGTVGGVLGVLAALTFATGVHDAATNPARYGQTHQLIVFLGFGGQGTPPDRVMVALAADPDVTGVEERLSSSARSGHRTFSLYRYAPGDHPIPAGALQAGRLPATGHEILLAALTADKLGAGVGDRVPLTGQVGSRDFTVTGVGFVPEGVANSYADGALVTADGYRALFATHEIDVLLVTLRPGADVAAATARLGRDASLAAGGARLGVVPFFKPRQLTDIQGIPALPIVLGGFLAALALAATGHALAVAVRRRRHEVAVLRALGMTPAQSRWIALTQAGVLALIGLVAGMPLGLALGRVLWRAVAESTPLLYVPPTPVGALLLIAPATLLAAAVLAVWPARTAARIRVADVLRAE